MAAPHKHKDLIIAWANGAEIEYSVYPNDWIPCVGNPVWNPAVDYRVKPKPDIVEERYIMRGRPSYAMSVSGGNIKLTFDGETGDLKSVEKI